MIEIADYDTSEKTRVSMWEARDVFPLKKRKPRVLKKIMRRQVRQWRAISKYVKVHLIFWEQAVVHGIEMDGSLFVNVEGSIRCYTNHSWPLPRDNAGLKKMVTRNFFDNEG